MKLEYLPLLMQLTGLICACAALWLLFGAIVALITAAVVLLGLGFWLESRRESVNSEATDGERGGTT